MGSLDDMSDYSDGSGSGSGLWQGDEEESSTWISILQIIFCSVGLLGNLIVIFVILVLKEYKKTVTNWYVLQLAIADLLFLCTIPVKIKERYDGKWPGSEAWCKLNESIIFLNYNSSIIFLTVMSVDRYLIVCHNASRLSEALRKRTTAYIATIIVWAVSLLLCTPIFMYSKLVNCNCMHEFPRHQTTEARCREIGMENELDKCLVILEKLPPPSSKCDDEESELDEIRQFSKLLESQGNSSERNSNIESGRNSDAINGFLNYKENEYGTADVEYSTFSGNDITNQTSMSNASSFNDSQKNFDYEGSVDFGGIPYECSYENESNAWFSFIYFNFVLLFIIPFTIMLICYSLIVKRMVKSKSRKTSLTGSSTANERPKSEKRKLSKSEKIYRKATQLCVAYVVLFAICWLPFHSVHLAKIAGMRQTREFCLNLTSTAFFFVISNSVVNPCLYSVVGKKFLVRLRTALSSLQGKIASQVDSFSSTSGLAVRYRRGKRHGSRSHSNTATATTKIYKGKSEVQSSDRSSGDGLHHSGSGAD